MNESYFNLETTRLVFRKLTLSDAISWEKFFVNNDRLHFLGINLTNDHSQIAREWVEKQIWRYKHEKLGQLAVINKENGAFIGVGGIIPRNFNNEKLYEITYSLIPQYWNNGFATEIAQHLKKVGKALKISEQFISIIHIENHASMNVAGKNNMMIKSKSIYQKMPVYLFACIK